MLATISRQLFSHARSDLAAAFISGESNRSTSAAVAWHASAQLLHEYVMSGLRLEIMHAARVQTPAQSDTRCNARA
jgi:hypothetical protein